MPTLIRDTAKAIIYTHTHPSTMHIFYKPILVHFYMGIKRFDSKYMYYSQIGSFSTRYK